MLNTDELMVLLVNELIMPRTFYVKPTQVAFVSGLGRIDYVQVCSAGSAGQTTLNTNKTNKLHQDSIYVAYIRYMQLRFPMASRLPHSPQHKGAALISVPRP